MSERAVLDLHDIELQFGGLQVLHRVSMTVRAGEIHALIGPNGAGKTSLINVITGFYRPSRGVVLLDGEACQGQAPHRIARQGVGRTFQTPHLISDDTCAGNVFTAFHMHRATYGWGIGRHRSAAIRERTEEVLQQVGLGGRANQQVSELSLGEQRRLELARACALNPDVLLLDEVASGLSELEASTVAPVITHAAERGAAVVLVEHSMSFVRSLADSVTVLVEGHVLTSGKVAETLADPAVVSTYLGVAEDG